MEAMNYTSIGPVLQLNKAGELTQKRMKAVKVCDGLYTTAPDKSNFVHFIIECDGVMWVDCKAAESKVAYGMKMIPGYFEKIKAGCFDGENIQEFRREISRRINHPDSPAIMELKKPERKKPEPLPEGAKKVSVYMIKGCTAETTDKKVVVAEVAPHVYTYTYKLKNYGERVKIIFEIDGVYFQGHDTGAYVLEREDFTEICTKAYKLARQNVADGAASGMAYFIEVQKRIDAATPTETPQISTKTAETVNVSAEGENKAERAKYRVSRVGGYKIIVGDREQGKVIAVLMAVNGHNTIEINDESAHISTTGEKLLQIDKPIMQLSDAEVLELIYGSMQPPQPSEAPHTVECTTDTPKPRETARKPQNRSIGSTRHSRLGSNGYAMLDNASATLTAMHVPRECSTADAAYW